MRIIAHLSHISRGNHFRAYSLRTQLTDPFLGVDHAWMSGPTFPPHSHVGFSAVSYLFTDSETEIENLDSIGNQNLIRPGGLHWAAAGKGITHEEKPAEYGKTVHSLQIFVDLLSYRKDMEPQTLSVEASNVPVLRTPGAVIRVAAGTFGEVRAPIDPPTEVTMLDISLEAGAVLAVPIEVGQTAFVLPISGSVDVNGERFAFEDYALPVYPAQPANHTITLHAPKGNTKIMLFAGAPLSTG